MERSQWQAIAVGASLTAFVVAIATGRLPRGVRIALVLGIVVLAGGAGFYAYRYATHPTTLTVAAGSVDGAAVQLMSTIATRLASTDAPVRLKVLDKGSALDAVKAFSAGQADLAVARADIGDLSGAATVVVVTRSVVLIVAPPGSSLTEMDDLKGKTIGVVAGEVNQKVVEALTGEYGLDSAKTHFKDLAPTDIPRALKSKQVSALLVVMPITGKYLTMLRNVFPKSAKQKPVLIPIESAGAIAAVTKYYQSYDLPKGTIQGSPPIPDDDMKTLQVPLYLVANKKLSDEVVSSLAKAIMDARRDLLGEDPLIAQISEPDTDKTDTNNDTYIPVHPGATAYFGGNVQSFLDKHGDQIFYGSMLLGTLASLFAAAWKFMTKDEEKPENRPLMRLHALTDQISKAGNEADLAETESRIDDILKGELEKYAAGNADATEAAAMGLATHRLEHLIAQRRTVLNGKPAPTLQP
jgi:TRAP transporter TAXI family solute receptor